MHGAAYDFVAACCQRWRPQSPIYEVGALDINGSVRGLFGGPYVGIDLHPGRGVDVVGDARVYVPAFQPATIVCCEVLEHTPHAAALLAHLGTVLAPGGVLILTAAGPRRAPHSGLDGGPLRAGEYYGNVTPNALARWLDAAGLTLLLVELGPLQADVYAVATA
jgi:hypothetical protein